MPGWEPFVEPWMCSLSWQQQAAGRLHPPRLKMGIRAKQRLDVNLTSVLLGEYINKHAQAAQQVLQCFWFYTVCSHNTPYLLMLVSGPVLLFFPHKPEMSFIWSFQNSTTPPRSPGWLTTVMRRNRLSTFRPHCSGWAPQSTLPT